MTIKRTSAGVGLPGGFPFSVADEAYGLGFISGIAALDLDAKFVPGTFEEETELAWNHVAAIAEASGCSIDDIVYVQCVLSEIDNYGDLNVWWRWQFPDISTAPSTVHVPGRRPSVRCEDRDPDDCGSWLMSLRNHMPGSRPRPPVTRADVAAAGARLGNRVRRTPVLRVEANQLTRSHPAFWPKLELLQCTGAFKARGALRTLMAAAIPPAGVCAASGGNHGQAVAWAARLMSAPASVFVPVTCLPNKLRRLADYGADVTVIGDVFEQSLASAEQFAAATGALLVHPFDQPLTVAGVGTVTAEFSEQVPELDTILIAVGGGGLLAGALAALEGRATRAVAVEPSSARCLGAALEAGQPIDVAVSGPAFDSLGVRRVGRLGFDAAVAHQVQHIDVADEAITAAQLSAWEQLRIGLEAGGATALAALLSGAYEPQHDEVVGVVGCGGNVDIAALLKAASEACTQPPAPIV